MKNYKVSFWFKQANGVEERVVYLETDKREKRDIIAAALKEVGTYPRSYEVTVEECESETLYVIQLSDTRHVDEGLWYHDRDGELFVVRRVNRTGNYATCHYIGNSFSSGHIQPNFCTIIKEFKAIDILR